MFELSPMLKVDYKLGITLKWLKNATVQQSFEDHGNEF